MPEPVEISTCGCCVTRDIFRIADKEKLFKLKGNVGFTSPFSMFSEPVEEKLANPIIECVSNTNLCDFDKRNVINNVKGNTFNYLVENRSDYLVLDLADLRFPIWKKGESAITLRSHPALKPLENHFKMINDFKKIQAKDYNLQAIKDTLKTLAENILTYWKPENIFLINTLPVGYLMKDGKNQYGDYWFNVRNNTYPYYIKHIHIINVYMQSLLQCHLINLPRIDLCAINAHHTWGPCAFHYTDDIYLYLYNQICQVIFPERKIALEEDNRRLLSKLKNDYYRYSNVTEISRNIDENVLRICSIQNIYEYLEKMQHFDKCICIISVKDTAGFFFDQKMQDLFLHLGLCEDLIKKFMVGYIAVINQGMVVFEKCGKTNESVEFIDDVDYIKLSAISKPFKSGNVAQIAINGIDYAVNSRGFNIVIYDVSTRRVVDSVSIDTHVSNFPLKRKPDLLSNEERLLSKLLAQS